jgi:hypothetical protein
MLEGAKVDARQAGKVFTARLKHRKLFGLHANTNTRAPPKTTDEVNSTSIWRADIFVPLE